MKKLIFGLTFIVGALFANSVMAQEVITESVDGPVISIDKDVHDYGKITQGANGTCVFTVTNTGNEPLIISLCKGSCGCTVPSCPKEPIAPGATAEIKVKYDTNRVGQLTNRLLLLQTQLMSLLRELELQVTLLLSLLETQAQNNS